MIRPANHCPDCHQFCFDQHPELRRQLWRHCQAGKMCGTMVKSKGTKKADWQSEYDKCMTNPDA
jgi:hypothetical protein